MQATGQLLGRICVSIIFLISGLSKIFNWSESINYMESKGMTTMVPLLLCLAIIIEVLGGISLLLGYLARIGAGVLLVYLIIVTIVFHNFWTLQGVEQPIQIVNFLKNLAIIGGLFYVTSIGAGRYSFDG